MVQRTLMNKVNRLKALEAEKKSIEKQMEVLQGEVKAELQNRGTDETTTGDWIVRFKEVVSNKFNGKQFKADHPRLYQKYMAQSQSMRLTVTESI